jgi:iron(III) transport system permease protein
MLEVSDSILLAQRDRFYPITKQIWQLMGRIDPGAPGVACALGLLSMGLLAGSLLAARRLVGRRSRSLFQA